MQRLNLRDPELRKLIEETENFQGPEEETIDLEELRQYEDYDLNQVRAEMRRLNMEIDSHTQLTPIEVRKLIMKNEILFKKIEKVEDCVHDARLVKNLSLIVQNNMSKVSTNAITFRHEDFSKKIIEMLAQHKKDGEGPGMNKEMLIKLGLQAKKFIMKSPSLKVMKGALRTKEEFENKPPPKERKVRQKARTRDCDLVATQATILQETETTDAQSDRKVVNLFKIVVEIYKSCKGPINYFQLVIDPNSFATTVQNIFHISYLVKEGKVSIKLEDKIPYITPLKQKHKGGDSTTKL